MSGVSILERDWTPVESHRTGDHRQCGGSCPMSGSDMRESPIFTQAKREEADRFNARDTYNREIDRLIKEITSWHSSILRNYWRDHGIRGFSRASRSHLEQDVLDSMVKHLSGQEACNPNCHASV